MNDLTPFDFTDKQKALIKRTVARDCNDNEFEQFIHVCRHTRLDPLRRQIYAFVYNKHDPRLRQLVIVVSINGYRAIADRTGNYRPDEQSTRFEYGEKDPKINPLGIVKCETTVYKHSHGEWYPINGTAYWDEYVPLYNGEIDRRKTGWAKMPRIMLSKVAEASALRKAWPDDFAGLYGEEEMDREHILDLTATEVPVTEEKTDKPNGVTIVPIGEYREKVLAFITQHEENQAMVWKWKEKNKESFREYWAQDKAGAFQIGKALEKFKTESKEYTNESA
jgi:phage recombination protein Bet